MKQFGIRRVVALALVGISGALAGTAYVAQRSVKAHGATDDPRSAALKAEEAALSSFNDSAVQATGVKLHSLQEKLWTSTKFEHWVGVTIPKAWTIQELDGGTQAHLIARRYVLQKPNASDSDWPEIKAVLGNLERAACVSVQSVTLSVQPGYDGSRHFTQCQFVAAFYFQRLPSQSSGPTAPNSTASP